MNKYDDEHRSECETCRYLTQIIWPLCLSEEAQQEVADSVDSYYLTNAENGQRVLIEPLEAERVSLEIWEES